MLTRSSRVTSEPAAVTLSTCPPPGEAGSRLGSGRRERPAGRADGSTGGPVLQLPPRRELLRVGSCENTEPGRGQSAESSEICRRTAARPPSHRRHRYRRAGRPAVLGWQWSGEKWRRRRPVRRADCASARRSVQASRGHRRSAGDRRDAGRRGGAARVGEDGGGREDVRERTVLVQDAEDCVRFVTEDRVRCVTEN